MFRDLLHPKKIWIRIESTPHSNVNIMERHLVYYSGVTFWHVTVILNFDVLLTVHLSIFISVINQLDAQNDFF